MAERYAVSARGDEFVLEDRERTATAIVAPVRGNNVTHFRVRPANWSGPTDTIDVLLPPSGAGGLGPSGYGAGNPILFPFPNRVRHGRFKFEGREHQLDVNETARGNHIHGLVSALPWTVDDSGADVSHGAWLRASVRIGEHEQAARQYPYPCVLEVTTRLLDGALVQEVDVRNTGEQPLPMGFGIHPWFPAAIFGGERAATQVRVRANRYWELEDLVPTGRTLPVAGGAELDQTPSTYDLREWVALDAREYDDVFTDLLRRPDGWSEGGIRYPNVGLELAVEASPEFREWVIYAPEARPVVCLEPYSGTTNSVNLQPQGIDAGLVVLEPGCAWSATIRTSLKVVE
jgi:aldose 1-epimerase